MKKKLALILVILTLGFSLTACGENQTETGSTSPEDTEPVTIVLWHTYTDHHQEALDKIIKGFNESQAEYVLEADQQPYSEFDSKLLQAVSSGTGPDLCTMFPSDAINYMNDGYLYEFTDFINDSEIGIPDFKEQVAPGLYAEITQWGEDEIYLMPCTFGSEVLYYNKTMFDELGLEAPTTWSELEECAKSIYDEYGIAGFGTDSITDSFQGWITQAGSSYIDTQTKEVSIDRDIAIEKLNWFANGVQEGYFRLVGEDHYFSNPFGSQAVGMYVGSAAGVDYVFAAVPEGDGHFEVGCTPLPQEGDTKYVSSWGSTYICLSPEEENAKGAYTFLKYLIQEEILVDWAMAFGATPAYKESIESDVFQEYAATNIAVKALVEEYDYINYLPSIQGAGVVRTEIDKMVQNVALGLSDAETAFDEFFEASNAALSDQ